MNRLQELLDQLRSGFDGEALPPPAALVQAMDPVAWTMLGFAVGALLLAVWMRLRIANAEGARHEAEAQPASLLARLKRRPASIPPAAILQRLGSERVEELLEYGDQVEDAFWLGQWTPVREELLRLMSAQHAFAPVQALVNYYRCADRSEAASLRIRRTALIHKLGQRRWLPPGDNQAPAQLLVFTDGDEQPGELGFAGRIHWLRPEHRPRLADGPMVELDPISFTSLSQATLKIRIYRSLLTGAGFRLHFTRVGDDWIVAREEREWAR